MKTFKQHLLEFKKIHGHVDHFVDWACSHLNLAAPPKIELIDDKKQAAENCSFGGYNPADQSIKVNIAERHPVDVLRTLAHELVHHKQNLDGRIQPNSGETGSDIENEANSEAGIMMRKYGRMRSSIFESTEKNKGGSLHAFDVDGTLMHTTAKVHVKNHEGKVVHSLSHDQFNSHKLEPGHHYDFSEFKSAHHFDKEKPIRPMLAKLKAVHKNTQKNPHSKVIINTARSDFDDKHHFAKTWHKYGVDINKVHVERAGNIEHGSTPEKKAEVMRKHLNSGKYREAHLYDDDKKNLDHFLKLKHEYSHIKFHAHHVQPNGSTKKYTGD